MALVLHKQAYESVALRQVVRAKGDCSMSPMLETVEQARAVYMNTVHGWIDLECALGARAELLLQGLDDTCLMR